MVVPVLTHLESRQQWLDFCRREKPYCFIQQPHCLVDFQSTYLKLTILPDEGLLNDAIRYSLGSRNSMEPIWRLIKGCEWSLQAIIEGLEEMDFSSNVRDNALLKRHTDLTARKYFSRERLLVSPEKIGTLSPLMTIPEFWDAPAIARLISHQQFQLLRNEQKQLTTTGSSSGKAVAAPTIPEIMQILIDPVEQCHGIMKEERLIIFRGKQPFISLLPDLSWPKPRLAPK